MRQQPFEARALTALVLSGTALGGIFGIAKARGESSGTSCTAIADCHYTEQFRLKPADLLPEDRFAEDMDMHNNRLIAGARGRGCIVQSSDCGRFFIFKFENGQWIEEAMFDADEGERALGSSVAIRNDLAVVTSSKDCEDDLCGVLNIYRFNGSDWVKDDTIEPGIAPSGLRVLGITDDRILAGSPFEDCDTGNTCGAAYVYHYDGNAWNQEIGIALPDALTQDRLGEYGAMSGNTIAVTIPRRECDEGLDCGEILIYEHDGNEWSHTQTITSTIPNNELGRGIDVHDDWLAIGPNQGVVRVFRNTGAAWVEQTPVPAPPGYTSNIIASYIGMTDDLLMVGAVNAFCNGNQWCGTAFLYEHDGNNWVYRSQMSATDSQHGLGFGAGMVLDSEKAVVSVRFTPCGIYDAPCGTAYVFEFENDDCECDGIADVCQVNPSTDCNNNLVLDTCEIAEGALADINEDTVPDICQDCNSNAIPDPVEITLDPSLDCNDDDLLDECGLWINCDVSLRQSFDVQDPTLVSNFGASIDVSGSWAVVGAPGQNCDDGDDCGVAQVFEYDGQDWQFVSELSASDPTEDARFGHRVAIDGDAIVVSAPHASCGAPTCGAVYTFTYDGADWVFEQKLTPNDSANLDMFGSGLDLDNGVLVVGAEGDNCGFGPECGAYVYRYELSTWNFEQKIIPGGTSGLDKLGYDVAISGNRIVVAGDIMDSWRIYVFEYADDVWTHTFSLDRDGNEDGLADVDVFGDNIVVANKFNGVVRAFRQIGVSWVKSSNFDVPGTGHQIGTVLALDGDHAVIANPEESCGAGVDCGIIHLFVRDGFLWDYVGTMEHQDQVVNDELGFALAMSGGNLLASARQTTNDENTIYHRSVVITENCNCDEIVDACEPDCDFNAVPDACEAFADCNNNGEFDACEIAEGLEDDCNLNSVPDSCDLLEGTELDCNSNNIPDTCDLPDCNNNGVPDSCDFDQGTELDCNNNGLPDTCDVPDCNLNDIPDECDIAEGTSDDVDENGVPDECFIRQPLADNRFNILGDIKSCDLLDPDGGDGDCHAGVSGPAPQTYCMDDLDGDDEGACYVARSRFLSIIPQPENAGNARAYRISLDMGDGTCSSTTALGFAGEPEDRVNNGQGQSLYHLSKVDTNPAYHDWSDPILFSAGVITIGGCEISTGDGVDGRTYCVQAIAIGDDIGNENNYSDPLILHTVANFGDVTGGGAPGDPPNGIVSLADALAAIIGFQQANNEPKDWLELVCDTNLSISLGDAFQAVKGFQGESDNCPAPTDCP